MKTLLIRFSEKASRFETEHNRVKDIAEFLGVSQNRAVAYAINMAWQHLADNEDMLEELEFRRRGYKVGKVACLNTDEEYRERIEKRIAKGVPLPLEDDSELESGLLFRFLSPEQQDSIRAAASPEEKRRLKAKLLAELAPDDAANNFLANR